MVLEKSRLNFHRVACIKPEVNLNNLNKISPYRNENTTRLHYKDQLVNAV
jgi:hypothetical protein